MSSSREKTCKQEVNRQYNLRKQDINNTEREGISRMEDLLRIAREQLNGKLEGLRDSLRDEFVDQLGLPDPVDALGDMFKISKKTRRAIKTGLKVAGRVSGLKGKLDKGYLLSRIAYYVGEIAAIKIAAEIEKSGLEDWKNDALKDCEPASPLILDLDGDGVEADALAHFDHEGDGWNELSRWADEDDGVLVWDRNADGVINDGSELFGNNTSLTNGAKAANGFAALADLDSNNDGVVNSSDANWANLRVMRWTDANEDGAMQDSERRLVTLDSLGIASLNTGYTNSDHVDTSGNEHRQVGSYTKKDGTTRKMTDVWFVTSDNDATYSREGIPEQSAAVKALPDIYGGGRIYNLRDAMALDDARDASGNSRLTAPFYANTRTETRSLREMVAAFTAKNTNGTPKLNKAAREALAEKILLRWAGAEGALAADYWGAYSNDRYGYGLTGMSYADARQAAVVEAFQGGQWRGGKGYRNPAYKTGQKIQSGYMSHLERLYGQLMLNSHMSDLHGKITVGLKSGAEEGSTDSDDYEFNFSAAATALAGAGNAARRSEFLRSLAAVYGDGEMIIASMKKTAASWVYEYGYYAEYTARAVFGGMHVKKGEFIGDCGCSGGVRDNVFRTTGGKNDRLSGRGGDDTYQLDYGAGHDRIEEQWRDSDFAGDDGDVIKIAPGIAKGRVKLTRTRDDMKVALLDANGRVTDSLTVVGHYSNPVARVEKVKFADGTEWGSAEFAAAVLSAGRGSDGVDTFDMTGDGFASTAYGGKGSDVYLLGRGRGGDVVDEERYNSGGGNADVDVVRLQGGLTAADVRLARNSTDLIIQVLSNDRANVSNALVVKNHYVSNKAKIERVELGDGTLLWGSSNFSSVSWTAPRYLESAFPISGNGSAGARLRGRSDTNDVFDSDGGGDDKLYGYGGNDVYWLGRGTGSDTIYEHLYNSGDSGDKIKIKRGIAVSSVRLRRSADDLYVQIVGGNGAVTDSLTVDGYYKYASARIETVEFSNAAKTVWEASDFVLARIHGGVGNENLRGRNDTNDVFDGDGGGDDKLYGYGGNDVYWLGIGTGKDEIYEHQYNAGDAGDKIKVKSGIAVSSVRLRRGTDDLYIQIVGRNGVVEDSLTVDDYYANAGAKVERLEFSDAVKTVWDANHFALARIHGTSLGTSAAAENLRGRRDTDDVFDGDAGGNDRLIGYGGDDVYWLGEDTDNDVIDEHSNNTGDSGDKIRIKKGIEVGSVRLRRNTTDLYVQIVDGDGEVTDSLKVEYYYSDASAKVETVEFSDAAKTVWDANHFALARIHGTSASGEYLRGLRDTDDVFDGDAGGVDYLYGYGGDDVYWLGIGTGKDEIYEHQNNAGDAGDRIRIKDGIAVSSVRLRRTRNDLYVEVVGSGGVVENSLMVDNYYTDASAKVEKLEFSDAAKTVWDADDFALARIRGSSQGEYLRGLRGADDVFDGDAGGDDRLIGYGGNDVYWLGEDTDNDVIDEHTHNSGDSGDKIRVKEGIGVGSVRLARDTYHLYVQVVDGDGEVTDSLKVENYYSDASAKVETVEFSDAAKTVWDADDFALARIRGGSRDENLRGLRGADDVFDGNAGGDDRLIGYGGDDVYWLGEDTDNDVIDEHTHNSGDSGDKIRVKKGIEVSSVRLTRDTHHLYVQIVDGDGEVTDSLKVENYYSDASAKVETVEFSDAAKTVWDANHLALARMHGSSRGENLWGLRDTGDVFDSDAGGDDGLYGYGGDDVYWLGRGTGSDTIYEHYHNTGDSGDKIKIEDVTAVGSVRLTRSGDNLVVRLLDAKGKATGDSLTVDRHYTDASAKIESIELGNKVLRESQFQLLIDEIAAFNAGTSTDSSLSSVYDRHWTDISTSA